KGHSLEGTWTGFQTGALTFSGNNFSVDMGLGPGRGKLTGTYTYEKDQLTLNPSDFTVAVDDPSKQALVNQKVAEGKPQMMKMVTDLIPIPVPWAAAYDVTMAQ